MELLMSIGQQIGVAIENARLYELARQENVRRERIEAEMLRANKESERRNRELSLLNRVISATTSDMSPDSILETICCELVRTFDIATSAAALLNEDGNTLTVVAECTPDDGTSAMGMIIPISENPATLYVMKHKTPLALTDAQNDILLAPVRDIMRARGTASILIVPILIRDEVIGTIGMDSYEIREFTKDEISLASRVTAAIATVLEKARINDHPPLS
jgi:GAF domain-containing protein